MPIEQIYEAYGNQVIGMPAASPSIVVDDELSETSENPVQNKVITEKIEELFTSVSNGKTLIASAITDKGVPTDVTDSFTVMAQNIERIPAGGGLLRVVASDNIPAITVGVNLNGFSDIVNTQTQIPPSAGLHMYIIKTVSTSSNAYAIEVIRFIDGWSVDSLNMLYSDYNGSWQNFDDVIQIGYNVGTSNSWTVEILGNVEGYTVGQKVNWSRTTSQNLTLKETD